VRPGWLVDHDQVLVFKQHIQLHRLWLEVGKGFWWRHPQLHLISLAQRRFGLTGFVINADIASVNELLNPRLGFAQTADSPASGPAALEGAWDT